MSIFGSEFAWVATAHSFEIPIEKDSPLAVEINRWMREAEIEGIAISTYGCGEEGSMVFPRVCQITTRDEVDLVRAKLRWG